MADNSNSLAISYSMVIEAIRLKLPAVKKRFDAAFKEFQAAIGVDQQRAACTKIETILLEDTPIGLA